MSDPVLAPEPKKRQMCTPTCKADLALNTFLDEGDLSESDDTPEARRLFHFAFLAGRNQGDEDGYDRGYEDAQGDISPPFWAMVFYGFLGGVVVSFLARMMGF